MTEGGATLRAPSAECQDDHCRDRAHQVGRTTKEWSIHRRRAHPVGQLTSERPESSDSEPRGAVRSS